MLTLPLVLAFWYAWFNYHERLRTLRWITLAPLIVASLAWIYGLWAYRTLDSRRIAQQLKRGQDWAIQLNYAAAVEAFEQARDLAHSAGDKSAEASALCDLGQAEAETGQLKEADLSLLSCITLAGDLQYYVLEASGYIVLGRLENFNDPFAARQHFKDALTAAGKTRDPKYIQGQANLALGDLAKNLGRVEEAYQRYQDAEVPFHELNDLRDEIATLLGTGELKMMQGRFAEAREDYTNALEYCQKTGKDPGVEAQALILLGDLEREVGDNRRARDNYQTALGILTQDPDGKANALAGFAELERKLGNIKNSRKDYGDALDLYQKMNDKVGIKNVLVGLGQLETQVGHYGEATHALDQADVASGKDDYPLGYANALLTAGDLNREQGSFDLARQYYADAKETYTDLGAQSGEANAWLGLGKLEIALGNSSAAIQDLGKAWDSYALEQIYTGEAEVQLARGDLELKLAHYGRARILYHESLNRYKEQEDRADQAKVLVALGDLELESGNDGRAAQEYYAAARGLYQQQESLIGEANVDLSEAKLMIKLGRVPTNYFNKAEDLYRQIGIQDKVDEIRKLESKPNITR